MILIILLLLLLLLKIYFKTNLKFKGGVSLSNFEWSIQNNFGSFTLFLEKILDSESEREPMQK